MASSTVTGRPEITVINGSRDAVWIAMYKRSPLRENQPPIAWRVIALPPQGRTAVFIPRDFQVCARYSLKPENPRRPLYQTSVMQVPHAPAGAGFAIEGVPSPDRRTWGAVLTRAVKSPGWYQVRIVNRLPIGVWSHVRQDGLDILPPRILPPAAALTEDLSSPFYLAVLSSPRVAGDLLLDSELAGTEITVETGESIEIRGEPHKGFKASRISETEIFGST